MIIIKIAMETAVLTMDNNCPNNRNTSLKILQVRYIPKIVENVAPQANKPPITAEKRANRSQKLMRIWSGGSFVFIFFTACTIFMTFFYLMRLSSRRSFCLRAITV